MITRSIGISPGLPWGGPLPGGGYDGKTKRLDRAVQRFAEWLHRRIAGPVQVRFNSHRLSGGAYIYPDATPDARICCRCLAPLTRTLLLLFPELNSRLLTRPHDGLWDGGVKVENDVTGPNIFQSQKSFIFERRRMIET